MTARRRLPAVDFARVRADLGIPEEFPPEVIAEATEAAGSTPGIHADDTALPLVTIDPPDSMDLDQAVHLARDGAGYRVSYAIADVGSFVEPGSALDAECWERGQTYYCPDKRIPLHPQVLSEAAASLLPDQVRPAALWEITLDAQGEVVSGAVRRTAVRSIARLSYPDVQRDFDEGTPHESIALLQEIGEKRLTIAAARGSIDLDLPEQVVEKAPDGTWTLAYRESLPCERWNAEISLLTGMVAGVMMRDGGVGVLRTLPVPEKKTVHQLRKTARMLGVPWPDGARPGQVMAALDRSKPRHVAFIEQSASLLRGAGYLAFTEGHPDEPHAGIGAVYGHVTAPLRRLVDRYATEICLALSAGAEVPGWVLEALPRLAENMQRTGGIERRLDNAIIDTVEAFLLADDIGETFPAVVVGSTLR